MLCYLVDSVLVEMQFWIGTLWSCVHCRLTGQAGKDGELCLWARCVGSTVLNCILACVETRPGNGIILTRESLC